MKERKYWNVSYVLFQCQFFNKVFELAFHLPTIIYFTIKVISQGQKKLNNFKDEAGQFFYNETVTFNLLSLAKRKL